MTTRTRRFLALVVFAVAGGVYLNTLGNDFVLDDRPLIEKNPLVRDLRNLPILFLADYWAPSLESGLYRPVVMATYLLNRELTGPEPRGFHAVNVLLHAVVSVLVLFVMLRVSDDPAPAVAGAFLFATHAVHTEAVANVVGRAELLMALFTLASFLAWLRGREAGGAAGRRWTGASLALFFIALLCKETAVTLIGVLALHDLLWRTSPEQGFVRRVRETLLRYGRGYAAFALLVALYLGLRVYALGGLVLPPLLRLDNPLVVLDPPWRVLNALQVALRYLGLLFFPLHLSYDYSFDQIPLITSFADPRAWGVLLGVGTVVGAAVWAYRASRTVFFGMGFYLITFSIVSNLIVLIGTILGERLLYLPSVGFCLALPAAIWHFVPRLALPPVRARAAFGALIALLAALHAARAVDRNPDWRHQDVLYLHDVEVVPNSAKALSNAGSILVNRGEHERALELYRKAIEIAPEFEKPYKMSGFAYTDLGRDDEALAMYDKALRYGARDSALYNNLGYLLVERGQVARGVRLLEKAVELAPHNAEFLDSLGWGYYKLGRLRKAEELLERSLALQPGGPSAKARRRHLAVIRRALQGRRPLPPEAARPAPEQSPPG